MSKEYREVVDLIDKREHLVFEGVYTHFASADEPGDSMNEQFEFFKTVVNQVEKPTYIHTQNSAASLLMDGQFCNAIRLGISYMDTILHNTLKIMSKYTCVRVHNLYLKSYKSRLSKLVKR